jgi:hypothetical protein
MDGLNLPLLFEDRPIIIVLISAIAYMALPDHIINMGIGIMQATDTED